MTYEPGTLTTLATPARDTISTPARQLAHLLGLGTTWGPIPASHAGVVGCDPLLAAVDDIRRRSKSPAQQKLFAAGDSSYLAMLETTGWVRREYSADGKVLTYHVAAQEPVVDNRDWVTRENARLAAIHAEDIRRVEAENDQRQRNAEFGDQVPQAMFEQRLHKSGVMDRLAAIEAAIDEVRAALAALNIDGHDGGQKAGQHE